MSKQIRVNKLIGSEDVKVEKDDYIGKYNLDAKSAQKWILDNLRGQYIIDDTQEYVEISRVGAEEVTSHSRHDDTHLKSISAIPALLKNAIFIEEYEDVKKMEVDIASRKDLADAIQSYSDNDNITFISGAKLLNNVEKSYSNGEKLLNVSQVLTKDGYPLIVEHGTNAEFTVFDASKIGSNSMDNGLFGAGFYFGTHVPAWLNAKHTMKVFLDIKHPFEVKDGVRDIYTEVKLKFDTPAMLDLFRFQKVFRQHPSKG